jgi:hypothetical protein
MVGICWILMASMSKIRKKKTFWLLVCNYVLLDYFKYQNQLLIALKQPKDLLTKNSMKMLIF